MNPATDAIEDAARELPPGYGIRIDIERHSAFIQLLAPSGRTIDHGPVDCDESWNACVNRLVTAAGADSLNAR